MAEALSEQLDALLLIASTGCHTTTGEIRCSDPRSGRTRGAEYGADAWCTACIAEAALTGRQPAP